MPETPTNLIDAYRRLWAAVEKGTTEQDFSELKGEYEAVMQRPKGQRIKLKTGSSVKTDGVPVGTITIGRPCNGWAFNGEFDLDGHPISKRCHQRIEGEVLIYFDKDSNKLRGRSEVICPLCKNRQSLLHQSSCSGNTVHSI